MENVEVVEVAPRDGLQALARPQPLPVKTGLVRGLLGAGIRRLELGAFVSPAIVPQMADTARLAREFPAAGARLAVLVPNARGAELAFREGLIDLVFVVSVSETHNRANVRRSVADSLRELRALVAGAPAGFRLRVNLATAFDCPFEGTLAASVVCDLAGEVLACAGAAEIGLCDTTGRALPDRVGALAGRFLSAAGGGCLAFHGHDTFGLGIANALAAYEAGVRVFDASAGGLGGCPFAPGASGNTATEDLVFTFENMGITTGVDLNRLLAAADTAAGLDPGRAGGHVRRLPRARVLAGRWIGGPDGPRERRVAV